ncbi:MAG: diacylglycerol/polyprenol kinase family protein [Thermodesulfobacteriota bacterium]
MQVAIANGFGTAEPIHSMARALYGFVYKIQKPRPQDQSWSEKIKAYCTDVYDRAAAAKENLAGTPAAVSGYVDEVMETLRKFSDELAHSPNAARYKEVRLTLSQLYEKILMALEEAAPGPGSPQAQLLPLKPVNYYRNIFHVGMGLVAVLLYQLVLSWSLAMTLLIITLSTFVTLEITRRRYPKFNDYLVDGVFGIIVRPRERYRVNASTYYLAALTIMTAITPKPALCIGLLVLAFGDPAASLAGRRWGRKKLWQEKSVAGTSAFFLVSLVATLAYLILTLPSLAAWRMLLICTTVSAAGAATELFSRRINDNFTIPVVAAGVAAFWF